MVNQGAETIDAFQQYYSRPPVLTTKESFTKFLYNPSDKSVFGRTGSSWSKYTQIYMIFMIEAYVLLERATGGIFF